MPSNFSVLPYLNVQVPNNGKSYLFCHIAFSFLINRRVSAALVIVSAKYLYAFMGTVTCRLFSKGVESNREKYIRKQMQPSL